MDMEEVKKIITDAFERAEKERKEKKAENRNSR